MAAQPIRIGVSACMMHPDPLRAIFKGKRLLYVEESMFHWISAAGALAYMIPTVGPTGLVLEDVVQSMDGILLSGGADMAPESYGETALKPEWGGDRKRDLNEIALVRAALKFNKPLLGVCRGHQVLNVALGGSLYQDILHQHTGARVHRDWEVYDDNFHDVRFEPRGGLQKLYPGIPQGRINSVHHQAIKNLAPELVAEAFCPEDGIIEAVRWKKPDGPFVVGVQWHPEFQDPQNGALLARQPIMAEFIDAAKSRRR